MAYTSDSEFDAETRVQLTNEIPPMDMYDGVHSALKNATWKWLLGFSDITLNLDYKGNNDATDEEEPLKIVNGTVADNYGPQPKQVWNPDTEEYETENPTDCVRMDLNGILLPEDDLFLHEIYRYLAVLYPDHPDWIKLLTHNEVIDAFENAAAMVDYKPNDKFFLLVAENLEKLDSDTDADREEFKLLLRNLTNVAYRRKYYGTSAGLKMIAAQIHEQTSVFPVGQYVPLKPEPVTLADVDTDGETVSTCVSDSGATEHVIDTFDPNFKKRFRLIDWDGSSHSITTSESSFLSFSGAIVVGDRKAVVELFADRDLQTEETSTLSQLSLSYYLTKDSSITYLSNFDNCNITAAEFNSDLNVNEYTTSSKAYMVQVSTTFDTDFVTGYNYGIVDNFAEMIEAAKDENGYVALSSSSFSDAQYINSATFESICQTEGFAAYQSLMSLIAKVQKFTEFEFNINPYKKDSITLPAADMIKAYDDELNFVYENEICTQVDLPYEWKDDFPLKRKSIISTGNLKDSSDTYAVEQVVGFNHGYIEIEGQELSESDYSKYNYSSTGIFNPSTNDIISGNVFCFVFLTDDDKKVVLEGALQILWGTLLTYNRAANLNVWIKAIPTLKNDNLCAQIYDDWNDNVTKRTELAESLEKYDVDSDTYNSIKSQIQELDDWFNECRINRDYFISDDELTIGRGSTLEQVLTVNYSGQYNYVPVSYIPETGLITHLDLGSISILPLVSIDQFAYTIDDVENTYDFVQIPYIDISYPNKESHFALPVLKDKFFEYENSNFQMYPSLMTDEFYEYILSFFNDNFTAQEIEKTYVECEAISEFSLSDEDSAYTLRFTNENKRIFNCITTGDTVVGNGLPDETYVMSKSGTSLTLNNKIPRVGTYVYKFGLSCDAYPMENSDVTYKRQLLEYDETPDTNPFNNGLYGSDTWPAVHEAYFDGIKNAKNFTVWDDSGVFDEVVNYLYGDKIADKEEGTYALIPSTVNFAREAFFEINIKHLNYVENRKGETENLMNVEWLDYLEAEADKASMTKDNVFVGTNLNLQTDMSGYYTLVKNRNYTDPDLKILFQTFNWTEDTIPAYAQVGYGGSTRKKWFQSVSDIAYPNVYGADYFDIKRPQIESEESELELNGGEQRLRNVYSHSDNSSTVATEVKNEGSVESLLFEVPLGEYDIQKNYNPGDGTLLTTVSFTFQKQKFSNLFKQLEDSEQLLAVNSDILSNKFFSEDTLYSYLGDYTPELGSDSTILNWPETTEENAYWTILNGVNIGNFIIKNSSLVIKEGSNYSIKSPLFGGVLLDRNYYSEDSSALAGYSQFIENAAMYYDKIDTDFSLLDALLVRYSYLIDSKAYANFDEAKADLDNIKQSVIEKWNDDQYIVMGTLIDNTVTEYTFIVSNGSIELMALSPQQFASTLSFENGSTEDLQLFYGTAEVYIEDNDNYSLAVISTPTQIYQKVVTKISLPRTCITDGSYSFEITVDPYFLSEGYLFSDDDTVDYSKAVKFCISENAIYYDDTLSCFYTNAKIYENGEFASAASKIALKFEEQRFFKDTKFISGVYKVNNTQEALSADVKQTATLTPIAGVDFDISDLTSSDRVLSIEEVNLRSIHNRLYEETMFSNYSTLIGEIHGVDEQGRITIGGYRNGDETYTANKSDFAAQIQKFLEVEYTEEDDETTMTLKDDSYQKVFTEKNPELKSPKIKRSFFEDSISNIKTSDDISFKYFKNYLILEGKINYSSPKFIESDGSTFFDSALEKISVGDEVIAMSPLQVSATTHRHSIKCNLYENGVDLSSYSTVPKIVKFEGNRVIAACDSDLVFVSDEIGDISSITEITLKAYIWETNRPSALDNLSEFSLKQIDYFGGFWYSTYNLNSSNANIICKFTDSTDFSLRSEIFNETHSEDWGMTLNPESIVALEDDKIFGESLGTEWVYYKDVAFQNVTTQEESRILYYSLSDAAEADDLRELDFYNESNLNKYLKLSLYENSIIEDLGAVEGVDGVGSIKETYTKSYMTEGPYIVDDTDSEDYTQKIYATNGDIEVYANKNILFVNSKTRRLTRTYTDGEYTYTDDGDLTDSNHWKKAEIPAFESTLLNNLKGMSNTEAYIFARNEIANLLEEYNSDSSVSLDQIASGYDEDKAAEDDDYLSTLKSKIYDIIKNITVPKYSEFEANLSVNADNKTFKVDGCALPLVANGDKLILTSGADYNIPADDYFNNAGNYDTVDFYKVYLKILLESVAGVSDKRNIYTNNISEIQFTENDIIFLLKDSNILKFPLSKVNTAEDIADPENWTTVESPAGTTYMRTATDQAQGTIYADLGDDGVITVTEPDFSEEAKAYTIEHLYYTNGVLFLGGYFDSKENVQAAIQNYAGDNYDSSDAMFTQLDSLYGSTLADSVSTPALFYLKDSEESLGMCGLKSGLAEITANDSTKTLDSRNVRISAINYLNSKVIFSICIYDDYGVAIDSSKTGELLQYTMQFDERNDLVVDESSGTSLSPKFESVDDYCATLPRSKQYSALDGEIISWAENNRGIAYEKDPDNTKGYLFDYITYGSIAIPDSCKVAAKSDLGFALNKKITIDDDDTGFCTVLIAIKTDKQIPDQTLYLNPSKVTSYTNSLSSLKVPTVEEVEDSSNADKVYSMRQIDIRENQTANDYGYPTLEEDEDYGHIFYEYDTMEDDDGNVTYIAKGLTNTQQEPIYYCSEDGLQTMTEEGYYKSLRRPVTQVSLYDCLKNPGTRNWLQAGIPVSTALSDINDETVDIMIDDDDFTAFIKEGTPVFSEYNYQETADAESQYLSVPFVKISNGKTLEDYTGYLLEVDKDIYDSYVSHSESQDVDEWVSTFTNGEATKLAVIQNAAGYIESAEGRWGNMSNSYFNWYERLSCKEINGKYYLFDEKEQIFFIKNRRYITSTVKVPYTYQEGAQVLVNQSMTCVKDGDKYTLELDNDLPINYIYFPPKGYGGLRNSTEVSSAPWLQDPDAFYDELLYNTEGEPIYLADANGNSLGIQTKAPKYTSFKNLVNNLGYIVSGSSKSTVVKIERDSDDILSISALEETGTEITFENPIGNSTLDDGSEHYLKIRLLCVADTLAPIDHLNDSNYFVEVDKSEIDLYTPNRVYFNPKGLPHSPVTINNKVYGAENSYAFYSSQYTNSHDTSIYECDENGKYVTWRAIEDDEAATLTSSDGSGIIAETLPENCVGKITLTKDARFNPRKPIYNTCEDWFTNEFYISGSESNPFWQIIKIYPEFDTNSKSFKSYCKTYSWKKLSGVMKLVEVDEDEQYVSAAHPIIANEYGGNITFNYKAEFIDLKNGELSLLIKQPAEKYRTTEQFVTYGISYSNSFYENSGILKDIWTDNKYLESYILANYTVNSTEDYANLNNKDASIVHISEMAILNKNREIIAYALFPTIELRSSSQHASFTCLINSQNMIANSSE